MILGHGLLVFANGFVVLRIQAVHHNAISDQNDHKADNRSLLGHPKAKGGMPDGREMGIEPIPEQNAAAKTGKKPYGEEKPQPSQIFFPMAGGCLG